MDSTLKAFVRFCLTGVQRKSVFQALNAHVPNISRDLKNYLRMPTTCPSVPFGNDR